jgi:endo-1,4-beta-xylanase
VRTSQYVCAALVLASVGILPSSHAADGLTSNLPVGTYPVGENVVEALRRDGPERDAIETRIVDVANMPFKKAIEIEVTRTAKYAHWANLRVKNTEPIQKGDVFFLCLYTKMLSTENDTRAGHINATFRTDWQDRAFEMSFTCREEWERQYVGGVAKKDYAPGEASLLFFCGFRPQKILLAEIQFINYEKRVDVDDLPVMPLSYEGMDPDATWRKEALARIERHRKSYIDVVVTDRNGNPVPNADVSVTMTKNAFGFGGTYQTGLYRPDRAGQVDIDTYNEKFRLHFNKAVLPNAMKWKQYPTWGKEWAPTSMKWLDDNGIPVRGHVLVWPGWKYLPPHLELHKDNPAKLNELTDAHLEEMLTTWRGRFVEWDVVNEIYMQHDMLDVIGYNAVVKWFKRARELDPTTKLTYNDANTLVNNQPAHQDHYYETIEWLLREGAPVDVMGFQAHIHSLIPPEVTYKRIKRFAQLGPEIIITEFDVQTPGISDELAGRYARDFMISIFSHPKTTGIMTWLGGNPLRRIKGYGKAPATAFYDENWQLTPIGKAWLDLKTNDWHTDVTGTTNKKGRFSTRGCHGNYEITVKHKNGTSVKTASVGRNDTTVRITL